MLYPDLDWRRSGLRDPLWQSRALGRRSHVRYVRHAEEYTVEYEEYTAGEASEETLKPSLAIQLLKRFNRI